MALEEAALSLVVTTFPSGTRDCLLLKPRAACVAEALHPLQLLELDRTARLIERVARQRRPLALVIA